METKDYAIKKWKLKDYQEYDCGTADNNHEAQRKFKRESSQWGPSME